MTRTIRVLLAMLIMATGMLVAAPAAHATSTSGPWSLSNQWSGKCLDDTSNGFRMWACNGTNPQKWIQLNWNDGTVRFQNVNTGRCIDHTYDFGLRTWGCNSGQNQSWWVRLWNDGTRTYQNQGTGLCLYDSTAGLRMATCSDVEAASWYRR
jgi:Ricin-type beta-trefoil lectin domain-like